MSNTARNLEPAPQRKRLLTAGVNWVLRYNRRVCSILDQRWADLSSDERRRVRFYRSTGRTPQACAQAIKTFRHSDRIAREQTYHVIDEFYTPSRSMIDVLALHETVEPFDEPESNEDDR